MKKISHTFIVIISFIWIALLFSFAISNQTPVGSITGRVTSHDNGAPIAGAKIWHPVLTDQYVKSDVNGYYKLSGVPEGKYTIYIDPPMDYESSSYYNVNVFEARQTQNINFSLYTKAPYFSVYMEKDVVMAGSLPSFYCSGYKTNKFSVKIYKLDPLMHVNYLQNSFNLKKLDTASLTKVYEKNFNVPMDEYGLFSISIKPEIKENGFYYAVISSQMYPAQRLTFNITDLGIIVKRTKEKLLIYSVRMKDGAPIADTFIRVYDNNYNLYKTIATGKDGIAVINGIANIKYGILASGAASYAYANSYEAYTGGKYKVYLYTERPVYRPGQVVYYKGIVRKDLFDKYENSQNKDVEVDISDTEGNIIEKADLKTNSFGSFNGRFTLSSDAVLGSYTIKTIIDKEESYRDFKVSEYKKPEYKVTLTPSKKRYTCGDKIIIDVNSAYYFGEPVKNAEVSYTVYQSPYYASWILYDDFNNNTAENEGYGDVITDGKLKLDADGRATIEIQTDKCRYDRTMGIEVEVKDKSLRAVTSSASVLVTRGLFDIAIKPNKYVYSPGDDGIFEIKAADYDNNPMQNINIRTTIYKIEYHEQQNKTYGTMETAEVKKEKKTIQARTSNHGTAKINYKFDEGGSYVIESHAKDKRSNDIMTEFYVWVSSDYSSSASSGGLNIVADKKIYKAGETAKILINFPWKDAVAFITIEGADIYSYKTLKISGFSKTIDVPVIKKYFPNVYIEVCVVKDGHMESISVPIYLNTSEKDLNIKIKPRKNLYKPAEEAIYDINVTDSNGKPAKAEFSFGVVDEALYAISEDLTLDIKKYFYGYKERQVYTNYSFSDYYNGGIDKEEIKIRRKFEDTAYFKADVRTDEKGRAQVKFILPENLTSWRATVRAVTANTFVGQNINNITVSKDVLVRLQVPRFIRFGDMLEIAGVVHNYSGKTITANVQFKAQGCTLLDEDMKTINIEKDADTRVPFLIKADKAIGEAVFTIAAGCGADSDGMELAVPVLAHGVEHYISKSQVIEDKTIFNMNIPSDIGANTAKLSFEFSPSIGSSLISSLEYLINYPYGCTEQTMNSFLPAVEVKKTLERLNPVGAQNLVPVRAQNLVPLQSKITKVAKLGLEKIYSYQHADGGWGWWQYGNSDPYLTGFVALGLNEAINSGVKVDKYSFNKAIAAVKAYLMQKEEVFVRNNYIYEQNGYINARVYLLYVLSTLPGKADKNDLINMFNQKNNLNNYSRALLAMAFINTDLRQYVDDLIAVINKDIQISGDMCHWPSDSYKFIWTDSDTETTAYILKTLIKLNPKDEKIEKGLRWLITQRTGNRWSSTKDTAVILEMLCGYILSSGEKNPNFTASAYLNNELIKQVKFDNLLAKPVEFNIPCGQLKFSNKVEISKKGIGSLYSVCGLQYFGGEENIQPQSNGLKIQRQYYKLKRVKAFKGGYIDKPVKFDGSLATGEKLRVKIIIEADQDYRYVLIEDMLPAGCEADMTEEEKNWGSLWYQKQAVYDEKVAFFSAYMGKGRHELTYNLRGEIPGEYHVMPASVYLMYAPQIRANTAEDRIKVNVGTGRDLSLQ